MKPVCTLAIRITVYGLLISVATLMMLGGRLTRVDGNVPQAVQDIRRVSHGFMRYYAEYGNLPYDSRGAEYALYRIKPYMKEYPSSLPMDRWNDVEKKVEVLPYAYINSNRLDIFEPSSPSNDIIVLSEKDRQDAIGVNVLTLAGFVLWYKYPGGRQSGAESLIGRHVSDFVDQPWLLLYPGRVEFAPPDK